MELSTMTDYPQIFDTLSPHIYADSDFLLFITNRLNSETHQHPALQINISLSGEIINVDNGRDNLSGDCLLISSNEPHRISSDCRWQAVLLLSAEHPLSHALAHDYLRDRPMTIIDAQYARTLRSIIFSLVGSQSVGPSIRYHISQLFQALPQLLPLPQPNLRVGSVVKQLRQRGNHHLSHTVLADAAALSDSHLSHLFRKETGMALRGYKLWRRTMEGTQLILQGKSITEASFESGFADTAHFSRSFKQQFGISPSALLIHAQKVIWLDGHDLAEDTIL
jgi:AraC-like DNA-binding protein